MPRGKYLLLDLVDLGNTVFFYRAFLGTLVYFSLSLTLTNVYSISIVSPLTMVYFGIISTLPVAIDSAKSR